MILIKLDSHGIRETHFRYLYKSYFKYFTKMVVFVISVKRKSFIWLKGMGAPTSPYTKNSFNTLYVIRMTLTHLNLQLRFKHKK